MLIKPITYTVQGDPPTTVTKVFHFHLSKKEMIRLAAAEEGGVKGMIERISKETNEAAIVAQFEKLVLLSYGVLVDDGEGFRKSDELRKTFEESFAYDALFDEITTSKNAAKAMAEFINGVFPPDMVKASEEAMTAAGGDMAKALEIAAASTEQTSPVQQASPIT